MRWWHDIIRRCRMRKFLTFWQAVGADIASVWDEDYNGEEMWSIVYREIETRITIGRKMSQQEFINFCRSRGFTNRQAAFICEVLKRVGLGRKLTCLIRDSEPYPNRFRHARQTIRCGFEHQPDYRRTYIANIAMKLRDLQLSPLGQNGGRLNFDDETVRELVANELLGLIFGD